MLGVAAFISAPTFAAWCLAFWNAKPAWRKDDDAAEAGMENDMNAMLGEEIFTKKFVRVQVVVQEAVAGGELLDRAGMTALRNVLPSVCGS